MIVDPALAPTSGQNGLHSLHLSVAGGISQFGAYLDTLDPGAWSSFRHWHSAEDEFILVLEGVVTLRDDSGMTDLSPGDAACWPHGQPNGHHLTNRGAVPCRYLIVGSRVADDICTYPDDGSRQINGATRWQIVAADGQVLRDGDLPAELLDLPPVWGWPGDGSRPVVIRGAEAPGQDNPGGSEDGLPPLDASTTWALSDLGGLTQFGAFTERLMPGAQSSHRHWHSDEDEFLYVLDGAVTLVENDSPHPIGPGTCVCRPKGVANAHCRQNRSAAPVRYVIAGTRWPEDDVTYPDIDLHYRRRAGWRHLTHKDGSPYPGWPKETTR
jgi:uncharacterized cupin superfamily protein